MSWVSNPAKKVQGLGTAGLIAGSALGFQLAVSAGDSRRQIHSGLGITILVMISTQV